MRAPRAVVPILCYHSIGVGREGPTARFTVRTEQFSDQMEWLVQNGYTGLTVPEYAEHIRQRRPLPPKPVVITFDDGYRDFATAAYPILNRLRLPVTLYVPTALVGCGANAGPEPGWPEMLNWPDVADLSRDGVVIGSHAHTHRELDVMRMRDVRRELRLSKLMLEDHIQAHVATFAYPYGYNSARTRRAVALTEYSSACGVKNSYSHIDDDVWSMARFLIEATHSLGAFAELVAGQEGELAPSRERPQTFAWRQVRRGRRIIRQSPYRRDEAFRRGDVAAQSPLSDPPVAILEANLERPIPSIKPRQDRAYRAAQTVVRLHGHTLGMVRCPTEQGQLTATRLAEAIWASLAPQILTHLREANLEPVTELPLDGLPGAPPDGRPPLADPCFVSVVIATLDRPERVAACVKSLLACNYPRFEIIVVDNAPELADTARIVADRFGSSPEVSYVAEPRRGVSAARNRGAWISRGDVITFVDDDVVVDPGYLTAIVRGLEQWPRTDCVTGLIVPAELETAAQLRMEQYGGFNKGYELRVFDLTEHRVDDLLYPYRVGMYGSGASLAIRAPAFQSLGGFDEALGAGTQTYGAEDLDILLRVLLSGLRLVYQPDAVVWHYHRRFDDDVARQIYRYGVALAAVFTKHALTDRRVFADIARRLPRVIVYTLSPHSAKNANRQGNDYPRQLVALELAGLLVGPAAYLRSRMARHRRLATRENG